MSDPEVSGNIEAGKAAKRRVSDARRLCNKFLPADAKWRRIVVAFLKVYCVVILPIYFLGLSTLLARQIVYFIWQTSVFGMLSDGMPYSCSGPGAIGPSRMCNINESLQQTPPQWISADINVVLFFVGGVVSLRLVFFCFETLERGLGIDFLSRLIEKFLPGPKA